MTPPPPPSDTVHLNALTDEALAWGLPRRQKVVLVMDLVESVRLMAANEAAVVQRWHAFVQHARAQVLPARHGRHVKSWATACWPSSIRRPRRCRPRTSCTITSTTVTAACRPISSSTCAPA
ncbi:hypothetical protein H0I39_11560 [Ottowia beijingensis]|uniref:Uncharacterized protein n=1 Tax=Ottowia beijingensis TaxID=1207057 RepID=A0A853IWT3_9BURK|nr:hypothetical protein [Ottowia beijingensis]NZA02227.1 hypothetical protein [Ottowia beijingensis]